MQTFFLCRTYPIGIVEDEFHNLGVVLGESSCNLWNSQYKYYILHGFFQNLSLIVNIAVGVSMQCSQLLGFLPICLIECTNYKCRITQGYQGKQCVLERREQLSQRNVFFSWLETVYCKTQSMPIFMRQCHIHICVLFTSQFHVLLCPIIMEYILFLDFISVFGCSCTPQNESIMAIKNSPLRPAPTRFEESKNK